MGEIQNWLTPEFEALANWLTPDWEQGNDHPEWCLEEVVEAEWVCSCGSDLLQTEMNRLRDEMSAT